MRKQSVTALEKKLRAVQNKIRKLMSKHNTADKEAALAQQAYLDDHTDAAHKRLISKINKQHAVHKQMNALELQEDNLIRILRALTE